MATCLCDALLVPASPIAEVKLLRMNCSVEFRYLRGGMRRAHATSFQVFRNSVRRRLVSVLAVESTRHAWEWSISARAER